jgi:hypothetical protein
MREVSGHQLARVAVGVLAVLAQVGLGFYYVLLPILMVPGSWVYILWLIWAVEMVVVIWLAIRHTWFALLVPILSLVAVLLIYEYGDANLGWGP